MDERERTEQDRNDAIRRAAELIEEFPNLTPDTIIAALDDEFVGSMVFPSATGEIVREVERLWRAAQVMA